MNRKGEVAMKIKSKVNVNVNKSENLNGNMIRMYEAPSLQTMGRQCLQR
ncbi:hypothetical protein HMPREF1987_01882 [Peptostreptococcaceae bacterium oral taxon 113 str. W5053]|nr:hypothetical protein HMPREF1987_01882 [Peptostreptococcaceae bacterium oral taxon 113 str. W5053]